MVRKRDGFVPISERDDTLPGVVPRGVPAPTHRERAPQARRHFTQLDQVTQLVAASEADADLGFMARMLALCSLPRANLVDQLQYVRRNGPLTLAMTAGVNNKLPYGNLPAPAPGVGLHRSGADAAPRVHPRRFALGVHAECRCLQQRRRGA